MATYDYEEFGEWADSNYLRKYSHLIGSEGKQEKWHNTTERVLTEVLGALGYDKNSEEYKKLEHYILDRKFIPGGRYLYAAGRELHQVNNCFLVRADDSREGWADLLSKTAMILQTGGGVGIDYSAIREYGAPIRKTGGVASGPIPLIEMVNSVGRGVMQGGERRSAIIALLDWDHPDCLEFIHIKDWPDEVKALKEKDFNFPAVADQTNISVNLNDEFFEAIEDSEHPKHDLALEIYNETVRNMITTGEPGFNVNVGEDSDNVLRNPCGEVCSSDDSDVCNLGSINLAKVNSKEELDEIVKLSTLFLLSGTVYSDVPYEKVKDVRQKNRRLGLGIMGVHEWLLKRDKRYAPDSELGEWLSIYAKSGEYANEWADSHNLSRPIATRAVAPTGTLGILGETTTSIEPIFCVAYKRRYLTEGKTWKYQYVVDPTAKRLIENDGVEANTIEDAYMLSYDVERRIKFQAWVQQYVDMGISSTINLPYQITDENEVKDFKEILLENLPSVRGITAYPDGARGGQPLVPSTYDVAIKHEGTVFEEDLDKSCRNGVCGA